MTDEQSDLKSDYGYDFFKPVYSQGSHYTVDFYGKKENGKLYFLAELQRFPCIEKKVLSIEEKISGQFDIMPDTDIEEDLRIKLLGLIKEYSKYYGNG